jgi:hypothetical protein
VSQDWPFSVTSKFTVDTGAEHLVTIRAATAADMRGRLQEASAIFPYASLISILDCGEVPTPVCPVVPMGPQIDPPSPPNGNGNGNGHRSPVAATVAQTTQNAHQRSAQARVARKAALPHLCPEHGKGRKENWGTGYHCPTQLEDGSYCKWRWTPEPTNGYAHPRDEN